MSGREDFAEYSDLALSIFKQKLGNVLDGVVVRDYVDHNDDAALFFELQLGKDAPSPLGSEFIYGHLDLRRALEDLGETRFPYLSTRRVAGGASETILRTPEGSVAKKRAS